VGRHLLQTHFLQVAFRSEPILLCLPTEHTDADHVPEMLSYKLHCLHEIKGMHQDMQSVKKGMVEAFASYKETQLSERVQEGWSKQRLSPEQKLVDFSCLFACVFVSFHAMQHMHACHY
jgi:hypothetical protein